MKISKYLIALLIPFIMTGCSGLGDALVTYTVALGSQPIIKKRIAGINYFTFSRGDSKDNFQAQNGFLCVTHNPGCNSIFSFGNSGTDKWFDEKHPLPLGCKVEQVIFEPYFPDDVCASPEGGIGGRGSYGARLTAANPYPPAVSWNNACQSDYADKVLYYKIGFIISMYAAAPIGEETFDVDAPSVSCAPANYLNYHPSNCATAPAHCSVLHANTTFTIPLTKGVVQNQQVYTGQLSINNGCSGKLTSISNPNLYAVTLINAGKTVALSAGGTITAAGLMTLYGNTMPALPVNITIAAPPDFAGVAAVNLGLNYNYYE